MKLGGGAKKGSAFERRMARELSVWWYGRQGFLWRRPGSGYIKILDSRHTGDIVPVADVATDRKWPFHCELKHYRSIKILQLLTQQKGGWLRAVWAKAQDSRRRDLAVLMVVKENRYPPLVFMSHETYNRLCLAFNETITFVYNSEIVIGIALKSLIGTQAILR